VIDFRELMLKKLACDAIYMLPGMAGRLSWHALCNKYLVGNGAAKQTG
jgi:hypothetical protein